MSERHTFDLPASFAQQRLWFLHQLEPDRPLYSIARTVSLSGPLNQQALIHSVQALVERHEALRTTFALVLSAGQGSRDGQLIQRIARTMQVPLPEVSLASVPPTEHSSTLQRLVEQEARTPFDLAQGPLLRVTLITLSDSEHVLLLTLHHIIADGWSLNIFFQELTALYDAYANDRDAHLPALPIQYADYAAWQREWLQGVRLEEQLGYWKQQLRAAPALLTFPSYRSRPAVQTFQGQHLFFTLADALKNSLQAVSQQAGVTLFMTLLAAFQVLLARYTGQDDIVVGSPIANRTRAEVEGVFGFFVNTLVLRSDLSGNPRFLDLLAQVRAMALQAYAHQDIPFERLVEELQPERDLSRNPLFQVMFAYQNDQTLSYHLANLTITLHENSTGTSPFDVTLLLAETSAGLRGILEYNTDLFEAAFIEQLGRHFQTLLEGIAADPAQPILALPLLTATEQRRMLYDWNATDVEYAPTNCIHEIFQEQAARHPDVIAVSFDGQALRYADLDARTNQLAHALRAQGVGPGTQVGIFIDRSLELVIAWLGVLKAGGAFVPLDPAYPQERIAFMLQDAGIQLVLTCERLTARLPAHLARVMCLDDDAELAMFESSPSLTSNGSGEDLAYVIYTSGSTGRPKGVMVPHRAVVNHNRAVAKRYGLQSTDRVLQFAAVGFDVALEECFASWLSGATVVLKPEWVGSAIPEFLRWVEQERLTVLNLPAPYWHEWVASLSDTSVLCPSSLRVVIVGSEKVLPERLKVWRERIGERVRWYNAYGLTEATITSTVYEPASQQNQEESASVPIGRPIDNVQVYILDALMQPVPVGVAGELSISGAGLALGYLNQPTLTAEKFVPSPFSDQLGARVYRTGDQARYRPDGTIEFLQRLDDQVKIRGFRIELGEIEAALSTCPEVKECAVLAYTDRPGEQRLVAYVIPVGEDAPPASRMLRRFLQASLPAYMIPSTFSVLASLPYTAHGKVDRRKLPLPEERRPVLDVTYSPPHTEIEQRIATLWCELLHADRVGVHDNFFDLGGHSLLMLQVQRQLQEQFPGSIAVVDLFAHPTVSTLASFIQGAHTPRHSASPEQATDASGSIQAHSANREIAVIGMAGRFPGARTVDELWQNLCNGVESITHFSDQELLDAGIDPALLRSPDYVKANAVLDDTDMFDAAFFGFTPKEAEITDPQHRVFLECAWEALEQAGYNPDAYPGRIGVYAGCGMNTYLLFNLMEQRALLQAGNLFKTIISNDKDYLPTHIAYKLNLRGPALNVNTACSTSLVTIHLACQSLLNAECDMALAGGVSLRFPQKSGYLYQEGGIVSPDGHCRAFDADAQGTVGGNGAGVVVLKRLADALADGDTIHAIIKGSAINNDGSLKVGYTAPGVEGQAAVITAALARAAVPAESISYIEAHGTGTPLGDPIELAALARAFRATTDKEGFCGIGSLKTNIGHLDAAAGVAGFIKTALALKHTLLPASLHFQQPNPAFALAHSPFYVNAALTEWRTEAWPRRAGVSSFGIGGTNAHMILEEPPAPTPSAPARPWQVLIATAKTETALQAIKAHLAAYLQRNAQVNFADLIYTLQVGRKPFAHRFMLVCRTRDEALRALQSPESGDTAFVDPARGQAAVAFLFPGQGTQYLAMARDLYQGEPVFRTHIDRCSELLTPYLGLDLRTILYPAEEQASAEHLLTQTWLTQPALFVIEYALAMLWMEWGIRPQAMIGHSIGEYTAACLAGVFSLEDGLAITAARGRLMHALPDGAMLAVSLAEQDLVPLLDEQISLAAVNGPARCVVSGTVAAITTFAEQLARNTIACQPVPTSHAFHSAMMEPALASFTQVMRSIALSAPAMPYVSNLTGTWITPEQATDPAYWTQHLRHTVRFADGLRTLLETSPTVLLEVGPGKTLSTAAKQQAGKLTGCAILSSLRHARDQRSDVAVLQETLGRLWLAGAPVNWLALYATERRQHIPLPTYPFERQRYWIEAAQPVPGEQPAPSFDKESLMPDQPEKLTANSPQMQAIVATLGAIWGKLLGIEPTALDTTTTFLELGADSLLLLQASQAIREVYNVKLPFRLMFEDYATLDALARYIAQSLPVQAQPVPSVPATPPHATMQTAGDQQAPPAPAALSSDGAGNAPLNGHRSKPAGIDTGATSATAVEQIVAQQLQVMAQQLALLQRGDQGQESSALPVPPIVPEQPIAPYGHSNGAQRPAVTGAQPDPDIFVPYQPPIAKAVKGLTTRQQAHLDALVGRLTKRTRGSREETQAYRPFLADSRNVAAFSFSFKEMAYPLLVQRASGARVWDVDGNEYVDLTMGFGALLFGHSPSFLVEALGEQVNQGLRLGPQSALAGPVARLVCELTGAERAFFCNSGTEAVMTALRLARTVTGRTKIAMFAGAYHGTFDGILAQAQTSQDGSTYTVPLAPGVPPSMIEDVIVLPFGEAESLHVLRAHASELAAILVEPFQSRRPDIQPASFLCELRQLATAAGTALIFDEVVTGFRTHPGGLQALLGVQADLTTYGKALGGGMPIGAIAGKAAYMDAIDGGMWAYSDGSFPEATQTFIAGTYFKHPFVMASVWAVLNHLKEQGPALQERLDHRTARLVVDLNTFFEQENLPIRSVHFSSLFRFVFPPALRLVEANVFFYHLLEKGIYVWEGRNCFLSTAHTDADIALIMEKVQQSIAEMRAGGFFPDTPPLPQTKKFPLTSEQKEVWFLAQMGDDAAQAYSQALPLHLRGDMHLAALRASLQEIVKRHEALRTTFSPAGDYQYIAPTATLEMPLVDLSGSAQEQHGRTLAEWIEREVERPFDLEHGPLLRVSLVKLAERHHVLVLIYHHSIIDGVSAGTLLHELGQIHTARCQGLVPRLPVPTQYSEYVRWQEGLQGSEELRAAEAFWLTQFAETPPALELPTDFPRPALKTYQGTRQTLSLDASLLRRLKALCVQQKCTLTMLLLAGYQVLLHRLTGQDDIIVGIPAAGQQAAGAHDLVGHCVNMLPVRTRLSGNPTFTTYLALSKKNLLEAQSQQIYPFLSLVKKLHLPRDTSRLPLVATTFNLDKYGRLPFADLDVSIAANPTRATQFDVCWNLTEMEDGLQLECHFNHDLFAQATIERWMRHWVTLLEQLVADPERGIFDLPLLTEHERRQLLHDWNETHFPLPDQQCIHQLIETQAHATPQALAVRCGDAQMTYLELDQQANRLGHSLQARGVGPEVMVGIYMERSLEMIIAILGILKAGGAYVPLDPAYPQDRIAYMLTDTHVSVLVSMATLLPRLPAHEAQIVCLDDDHVAIGEHPCTPPITTVGPTNLAYVIYTSGSSGKPKGVLITQRNLLSSTLARLRYYQDPVTNYLLLSSFAFDSSVAGIFWTLCQGSTLVLPPEHFQQDLTQLPAFIHTWNISHMLSVPSLYGLLLAQDKTDLLSTLRTIIVAGEVCPRDLVERHTALLPGAALFNEYGPTEGTVWSSVYACRSSIVPAVIPIGRPVGNVQLYVLDASMQPVPIGVRGELYIGGCGVARGYLNQPELTAQRFVPSPFSADAAKRLYRTGDLARWRTDGNMEFLGRSDDQVKVRGYRIEPGEIEAVLDEHPAIHESIVLAREDDLQHTRLVAYIVSNPAPQMAEEGPVDTEAAQEHVAQYRVLYDDLYAQQQAYSERDAAINQRVWTSSYTGQPLTEEEILESVEDTVQRILALQPERVLEIGCGTGLLLQRIAPRCVHYTGIDISDEALQQLRRRVTEQGLDATTLTLMQGAAHEILDLALSRQAFDTIIINEVVQHFPAIDYLAQVLEHALYLIEPGGAIFIGGLRSLPLLRTFHTSVQLHRASAASTVEQLQQRIREHLVAEKDLAIDPAFFLTLPRRMPRITSAATQLKGGVYQNEMTRFKYDVVLYIDRPAPTVPVSWLDWRTHHFLPEAVRQLLLDSAPEALGIKQIANARLEMDNAAVVLLDSSPAQLVTIDDVRRELRNSPHQAGIDPTRWWALEKDLPYTVSVTWSHDTGEGEYDVLFKRLRLEERGQQHVIIAQEQEPPLQPLQSYANHPLRGKTARLLIAEVRQYLQARLPDFMIPSLFVLLDTFPRTPNGKVDRWALPAPDRLHPAQQESFVAPRTVTEQVLATIWMHTLGLERISIHDNFFDLGGDSILSIQIIARANKEGLRLVPRQLFQHQTIAELATVANSAHILQAEQGTVVGPAPLTPIQHWFFEQSLPDVHYRNQAMLLKIRQPLEPAILRQALQYLLDYHDALRLRFVHDETGWQQYNAAAGEAVSFTHVDLAGRTETEQKQFIEETANHLHASLNISTGPLLRAASFDMGPHEPARLLLIIHHLAIDGVSWRIFLDDVQLCCQHLRAGEAPQLPPKTTSFKHWAERLQSSVDLPETQQELPYWLSPQRTQPVRLSVDFPQASNTADSTALAAVALSAAETRILLQEVPAVYHTQIGDILVTALAQTLAHWVGQRVLLMDIASHGREDLRGEVDLSRTVGWLTALAPIMLDLGPSVSPEQELLAVKEQLRRIPHKGLGYGILRYLSRETGIVASLAAQPPAEVLFNYLGQFDQLSAQDSLFEPAPEASGETQSSRGLRRHLIEVNGFIEDGCLHFLWVYSTNMHAATTIERLAQDCVSNVRRLIAQCLSQMAERERVPMYSPPPSPTGEAIPLLPSQHWFIEQAFPNRNHWNQALLLEARQPLDGSRLHQALQSVCAHHEALHARFLLENTSWRQLPGDPGAPVQCSHVNLAGVAAPDQQRAMEQIAAALHSSLRITEGPLLCAAYFDLGADTAGRLLLIAHHLAVDIMSWNIIVEDLQTCYQQLSRGETPLLPRTTSLAHWATQLRVYARSAAVRQILPYWLSGPRHLAATLPVDDVNGVNSEESARVIAVTLPLEETTMLLQQVTGTYHTQVSDAVVGALALALADWTGERVVLVDIEGHGREDLFTDVDLSRTVGWCTAIAPVVFDLRTCERARTLWAVKEELRRLPHGGISYGILRYLSQEKESVEQLHHLPQAQVLFNYLGRPAGSTLDKTMFRRPLWPAGHSSPGRPRSGSPCPPAMPADNARSQEAPGVARDPRGLRSHLLEVSGTMIDRQLHLTVTYSERIHRQATIERLAKHCLDHLRALIHETHSVSAEIVNTHTT